MKNNLINHPYLGGDVVDLRKPLFEPKKRAKDLTFKDIMKSTSGKKSK